MSEKTKLRRDEEIAQTAVIEVDCSAMDKRTRTVIAYLIDKELKRLKSYPRAWVENQEYELRDLRERISSCKLQRKNPDGTRPLSNYQEHMKSCATSKEKGGEGKSFQQCIIDWKELKEKRLGT